jgi:hypothetical protein
VVGTGGAHFLRPVPASLWPCLSLSPSPGPQGCLCAPTGALPQVCGQMVWPACCLPQLSWVSVWGQNDGRSGLLQDLIILLIGGSCSTTGSWPCAPSSRGHSSSMLLCLAQKEEGPWAQQDRLQACFQNFLTLQHWAGHLASEEPLQHPSL